MRGSSGSESETHSPASTGDPASRRHKGIEINGLWPVLRNTVPAEGLDLAPDYLIWTSGASLWPKTTSSRRFLLASARVRISLTPGLSRQRSQKIRRRSSRLAPPVSAGFRREPTGQYPSPSPLGRGPGKKIRRVGS